MLHSKRQFSKSFLSCLLAVLMLVSTFTACSPTDNAPSVTTEGTTAATTESTTAANTTESTTTPDNTPTDQPKEDPDAPIAYFSFDELNENNKFIEDKSGEACTSIKAPSQVRGKNGKALNLDGKSYLTFDMDLPTGNEAHSIAAWIKVDTSFTSSGTHIIAGWGNYDVQRADTRMQILQNKLCVSSRGQHSCNSIPSDISGTWHHFAFSYEKQTYRVYLDGKQIATLSMSAALNMVDTPLYIGNFAGKDYYFAGQIDDLYVFDRAITPNEVQGCMENAENFSEIEKNPNTSIVSNVKHTSYSGTITGKDYCTGIVFKYDVDVPQFQNIKEFALVMTFDGLNKQLVQVMANLYEEGVVPPTVTIGVDPGTIPATQSQGEDINARQFTYDVFSDEFPNFLVEELIPQVIKKHGLKISDSPDMHMTAAGSSGGICSWKCAWFRNDYFHRMYMSSPTFSAITKGFMAPVYMRLYETKAIRGFMDYCSNEPNEYFGDSDLAAKSAISALQYAGYQIEFRYSETETHSSQRYSVEGLTEVMRYVWVNWKTVAITAPRNSKYIERFVSIKEKWTETTEAMPTKFRAIAANGEYTFEGGTIYFTPDGGAKRMVATGFSDISSIAVSSDMWRLYIAERNIGAVYVMNINNSGELTDRMLLASLYTKTDPTVQGATQLYVDSQDRIFAVTEMGIQVIRSYGPVEAILLLPDGQIADEIVFGGANNKYMYARCGDTVYKRLFKVAGRATETTVSSPDTRTYY